MESHCDKIKLLEENAGKFELMENRYKIDMCLLCDLRIKNYFSLL